MNICIQNCGVSKKEATNEPFSLRLKPYEQARFDRLLNQVWQQNEHVTKSHIIRELLGLIKIEVLTNEQLVFFRTGEKTFNPNTDHPPDIFDTSEVTDYQMKGKKKISSKKQVENAMQQALATGEKIATFEEAEGSIEILGNVTPIKGRRTGER